jgi:formiminoglutamase
VLSVRQSDGPLIISIPHAGTEIPAEIAARLRDPKAALSDTDWHVPLLYDVDATIVATSCSRIVIDVNRDPSGASLYPGQATTGLVPTESFAGEPLYRDGMEPDEAEIAVRKALAFTPYHQALEREIARLRARHEQVILYDAHSIRSHVPRLFTGTLPVFNIGTNGGASAAPHLVQRLVQDCAATGESLVLNGRFRGGWITRHYGRPDSGVHAIQMELAQRFYMDEERPQAPLYERARPTLASFLRSLLTAL